jgi:hypothetical protein
MINGVTFGDVLCFHLAEHTSNSFDIGKYPLLFVGFGNLLARTKENSSFGLYFRIV